MELTNTCYAIRDRTRTPCDKPVRQSPKEFGGTDSANQPLLTDARRIMLNECSVVLQIIFTAVRADVIDASVWTVLERWNFGINRGFLASERAQ